MPEGSTPVPLTQLLGPRYCHKVEEITNWCLEPKEEAARSIANDPVGVFMDPGVKSCKKRYHQLIRRLNACGMLSWTSGPVESEVGLFCVPKKDGKQRLVIDCRLSNKFFRAPRHTDLPTGAALSRLQCDPSKTLFSSQYDLRNAFYQIELPECLRKYFALPAVPAHVLGLRHLGSQMVHPLLQVLPMGWTHALWWCQEFHETVVSEALGGDVPYLSDSAPPYRTSNIMRYLYMWTIADSSHTMRAAWGLFFIQSFQRYRSADLQCTKSKNVRQAFKLSECKYLVMVYAAPRCQGVPGFTKPWESSSLVAVFRPKTWSVFLVTSSLSVLCDASACPSCVPAIASPKNLLRVPHDFGRV